MNTREKYMKVLEEVPNFTTDETANAGSRVYKYLNLATILKGIKPIFVKYQLAFNQSVEYTQCGGTGMQVATVNTYVFDGEDSLQVGSYPVVVSGDPQALGSAVTYARRYSLYAALGIFPDKDDDGQAARAYTEQREDMISREYASLLSTLAKQRNVNLLQVASQVTGRVIGRLGELTQTEGQHIQKELEAM